MRAPVDIIMGTGQNDAAETYDGFVEDVQMRMQNAYDLVRKHIGEAALRNKRYYDIRVRPAKYKVGQWVYYFNPRRFKGRQDKWSRKYTGPFCVIQVLGPVNVKLQQTKRSKPFIVHLDKVKPFFGNPPKGWLDVCLETEVSELVEEGEAVGGHDLDGVGDDSAELAHGGSSTTDQPAANEIADVITFDNDQEFRRIRPRRQIRRPARFNDH